MCKFSRCWWTGGKEQLTPSGSLVHLPHEAAPYPAVPQQDAPLEYVASSVTSVAVWTAVSAPA